MPKQTPTTNKTIKRQVWGKKYSVLPPLDLLAVQKKSYKWFQDISIGQVLQEISPVEDFTGKNWTLTFHNYRIGEPSSDPAVALSKGLTYDAPFISELL